MISIDDDPEKQARILDAIINMNREEQVAKMYIFPWEHESLRATYQPIEFYSSMANSDEFNSCFLPNPIRGTDFMEMVNELGEYEFMQALKHARNATCGRVDFGAMLFKVGEENFRNIMTAYFRFEFDSPYAVSDVDISVDIHYTDLRRYLGVTSFNRMMNFLEYNNIRCKPFFNDSWWNSIVAEHNRKQITIPPKQPQSVLFHDEPHTPTPVIEPLHESPVPAPAIGPDVLFAEDELFDFDEEDLCDEWLDATTSESAATTSESAATMSESDATMSESAGTVAVIGNKRARIENEPMQMDVVDDLPIKQQYENLRAEYKSIPRFKWFKGDETKFNCLFNCDKYGDTKDRTECHICCRMVYTKGSKYTSHLKKCHPVIYNVLCLNKNVVKNMREIQNLSSVVSSFNCVLFNIPCQCVDCIKVI